MFEVDTGGSVAEAWMSRRGVAFGGLWLFHMALVYTAWWEGTQDEKSKVSKDLVYQVKRYGHYLDGTVEAMEDFKQSSDIGFGF